ncbi:MAG: peptidylprolyl isomerase [Candidatus Eisenbacteria bacterium]
MSKRLLAVLFALALAAPAARAATTTTTAAKPAAGEPMAVVLETSQGRIVVQLNEKEAPKTCANFRKLVQQGFYDGTYFHRVISGFMIQGGDPNTKDADPKNDGMGGPGWTVAAEIGLPHVRGAIATARQADAVNPKRESSGSQFFIDLAALPSLDAGGYTVFGKVIEGMDAVDKIAAFAGDTALPMANGGGRNPGKKALITKARLVPLSQVKGADKGEKKAPADSTQH